MQLKGKQIKDSSVEQAKLNVTTESITNISSVTNAEYVNTNSVNRVEALTYATLNMNMVANNTSIGGKACETPLLEFAISSTQVKVNNISVTVGDGKDCYFSPDGVEIRTGGNAIKGDFLYWNSSRFDLDNTDEIDFIYLTANEVVELSSGSNQILDPYYPALNVKYTGADDTDMTLTIDGIDFTVGNVAGNFVWDIGGSNETTITTEGDSLVQDVNGEDYTIWFDGFGSLLYSIKKGKFKIEIITIFGTGFKGSVYTIIEVNNKYVVGGWFSEYDGVIANNIIRLNQDGSIDTTFDSGTGFDKEVQSLIEDSNGKYIVGGGFDSYNGTGVGNIVRLNQDGSIDNTFIQGTGFNYDVNIIIEDSNGKYIVGGNFTDYNGTTVGRIVRLNQDGSIDSTFIQGTGFNNSCNNIIEDNNNKYVCVGSMTDYNGTTIGSIARLNQDGSIDNTFIQGTGFNYDVNIIIEDSNGKYIVGGNFTDYNGTTVGRIVRLNQDGSIDNTFIQGTGFNDNNPIPHSIIEDSNSKYLVVGYNLTDYNGTIIDNIVRLNQDGTFDSSFDSGSGFGDTAYIIIEDSNRKYVVGGQFHFYNNYTSMSIVRLNQDGSINSSNTKLTPSFHVRMTIDGDLGGFTAGTYIIEPTYNMYPDYYDETWVYNGNGIFLGFKYSNSYDNMSLYTSQLVYTYYYANVTSQQYPGFLSNNPLFFKTYNLGNGVTMTLEKVEV